MRAPAPRLSASAFLLAWLHGQRGASAQGAGQCGAAPLYRHGYEPPVDLECLSAAEAEAAVGSVMGWRKHWIRRRLGTEATMADEAALLRQLLGDKADSIYEMSLGPNTNYYDEAAKAHGVGVPAMREKFGWLFERVMGALSRRLGEAVAMRDGHALWFRIMSANETVDPVVAGALARIEPPSHYDELWASLTWPAGTTFDNTISFTLPLKLPSTGHGLRITKRYRNPTTKEVYNYDTKEVLTPEELEEGDPEAYIHPYHVGTLSLHSGHELHSVPPFGGVVPEDWRITLQGWGVFVPSEGWQIFG